MANMLANPNPEVNPVPKTVGSTTLSPVTNTVTVAQAPSDGLPEKSQTPEVKDELANASAAEERQRDVKELVEKAYKQMKRSKGISKLKGSKSESVDKYANVPPPDLRHDTLPGQAWVVLESGPVPLDAVRERLKKLERGEEPGPIKEFEESGGEGPGGAKPNTATNFKDSSETESVSLLTSLSSSGLFSYFFSFKSFLYNLAGGTGARSLALTGQELRIRKHAGLSKRQVLALEAEKRMLLVMGAQDIGVLILLVSVYYTVLFFSLSVVWRASWTGTGENAVKTNQSYSTSSRRFSFENQGTQARDNLNITNNDTPRPSPTPPITFYSTGDTRPIISDATSVDSFVTDFDTCPSDVYLRVIGYQRKVELGEVVLSMARTQKLISEEELNKCYEDCSSSNLSNSNFPIGFQNQNWRIAFQFALDLSTLVEKAEDFSAEEYAVFDAFVRKGSARESQSTSFSEPESESNSNLNGNCNNPLEQLTFEKYCIWPDFPPLAEKLANDIKRCKLLSLHLQEWVVLDLIGGPGGGGGDSGLMQYLKTNQDKIESLRGLGEEEIYRNVFRTPPVMGSSESISSKFLLTEFGWERALEVFREMLLSRLEATNSSSSCENARRMPGDKETDSRLLAKNNPRNWWDEKLISQLPLPARRGCVKLLLDNDSNEGIELALEALVLQSLLSSDSSKGLNNCSKDSDNSNLKNKPSENLFIAINYHGQEHLSISQNRGWANFWRNKTTATLASLSLLGVLFYYPYLWWRETVIKVKSCFRVCVSDEEFVEMLRSNLQNQSEFDLSNDGGGFSWRLLGRSMKPMTLSTSWSRGGGGRRESSGSTSNTLSTPGTGVTTSSVRGRRTTVYGATT